jgi:hypothetical protein
MTEHWVPIPSADGYEASDLGRIRSVERVIRYADGRQRAYRGQVLRPGAKDDRTLHVKIQGRTRYVHQLVLEAFVGPRPSGMECCHGDGDPSNNRLVNLRWDTKSSNVLDRVRHGTHHHANRTHCPRRHPLQFPNLAPSAWEKRGSRVCYACSRAMARRTYLRKKGIEIDLKVVADAYYVDIMSKAAS